MQTNMSLPDMEKELKCNDWYILPRNVTITGKDGYPMPEKQTRWYAGNDLSEDWFEYWAHTKEDVIKSAYRHHKREQERLDLRQFVQSILTEMDEDGYIDDDYVTNKAWEYKQAWEIADNG